MRKKLSLLLIVLLVLTGCGSKSSAKYKVGVLQFGDYASLNDSYAGMAQVLEKEDVEIVLKNAQSDPANIMINAQALKDEGVDVIYAITTQSAQMALNVFDGSIPVVFIAVTDPIAAGLVDDMEHPTDKITGVTDRAPVIQQLELMKRVMPDSKKVGLVYRTGDSNGEFQKVLLESEAQKMGLSVESMGVTNAQELALGLPNLLKKVDAMYLITDDLNVSNTSLIVDQASFNQVPVFASEDGQFDEGVLATVSISYTELGNQAGNMIFDILSNQRKPSEIPVEKAKTTRIRINEKMAKTYGVEIPNDLKEYLE
ncbi:MAG: ABC transporter substrate-binding protein [Erysipelothrix sp.]